MINKNSTTRTELKLTNNAYIGITADSTWAFSILIVARSDETDGNVSAAWKAEGCIARDEAGNTNLIGTPIKTVLAKDTDAAGWDITVEADDANDRLAVKVTGEATTTIRWVCRLDIAEVFLP